MTRVQLLVGVPQSGKTARCLSVYAEALLAAHRSRELGRTLWLAPAQEARQAVSEALLPLTGGVAFQPNVLTFDRFAERVLLETGQGGRALSGMGRRLVLLHVIRELSAAGRFRHFAQTAKSPGFIDVVSRFVSELKRAEIWPDRFQEISRQRLGRQDRRSAELGEIYTRYQTLLNDRNWYDAEGRFWLARTAMQKLADGFWRNFSLVVVDGFSDFTQTQFEILEQLAVTSARMIVTLPGETPSARRELFAKPIRALAQLKASFREAEGVETVDCRPESAVLPAGLRQILNRLFENPRIVQRSPRSQGCEIVPAVGEESERIAVCWRIKRLLAQGVSPREIVVGLRSTTVSGRTWEGALSSAGIPAVCESPPPWSQSPYLRALFNVLRLELEDWPFERLQAVLTSACFRPAGINWAPARDPQRVIGVLRTCKLPSQRKLILNGVEWTAKHGPEELRREAVFAGEVLGFLSDAAAGLRNDLDLEGWADAIAVVTTRFGLISSQETDRRDAERLQGLLRTGMPIEAELSDAPTRRPPEEFALLLRDIVRSEDVTANSQRPGCVRIVGAETLRHLRPAHVFLVEMTEDSFPSRRSDDCLLSETERLTLHDGGLMLSHRELQQQEELLLFYQAATCARERLTITYSEVNHRGHRVYPSPYVTAASELFDPALPSQPEGQLDPISQFEQSRYERVMTPADLRLAAVWKARHKQPGWWRLLLDQARTAPVAWNLLAAADIAALRFHTDGFTPYEGRLTWPGPLTDLQQRFSAERQFSATELETYAICPFRYWLSHVLNIEPLAVPEAATDHLSRGELIHEVLARLSEEEFADKAAVARRFRELVEERMERRVAQSELQRALHAVEQQVMSRWADGFADQHETYTGEQTERKLAETRTLGEIPFGKARDADEETPQHRFPPLELGAGGNKIRLGGRIDRVDVSDFEGQTVFTVIDYKTGMRPKLKLEQVQLGQALQLPIYLLAVMKLGIAGPDAIPFWMGYWSLRETGFAPSNFKRNAPWTPLDKAVWDSLEAVIEEIVPRLVAGIRAGQFVVDSTDPDCTGHCPYHTVCRVNQVRSVAGRLKKQRDLLPIAPTKAQS